MNFPTLFAGQHLIELESTGSTNTYLSEIAKAGKLPEGSVVWAHKQTEGKGQRGALWISEPGQNLTFSLLLYPSFISAAEQFMLSKAIALAMATCIINLVPDGGVSIKWPNDIYLNKKKVAGILIENSINQNTLGSAIVGIGLNINQTIFDTKAPNAISLAIATGKQFEIKKILVASLALIEAHYLQLKAGKFSVLTDNYKQLLYQLYEWHPYFSNGKKFSGRIMDVSPTGKLMVEQSDEMMREFDIKEIEFLAD